MKEVLPIAKSPIPNSNTCPICTKVFQGKLLAEHKVYHQNDSKFECPFCFKPFPTLMQMLKHKTSHARCHNKFQCYKCKKSFSRYEMLLSHFNTSHCIAKNSSIQPSQAFTHAEQQDIKEHEHVQNRNNFKCDKCLSIFTSEDVFEFHKTNIHLDDSHGLQRPAPPVPVLALHQVVLQDYLEKRAELNTSLTQGFVSSGSGVLAVFRLGRKLPKLSRIPYQALAFQFYVVAVWENLGHFH